MDILHIDRSEQDILDFSFLEFEPTKSLWCLHDTPFCGITYDDVNGCTIHWKDGAPHRIGGPAKSWEDGMSEFWVRGKYMDSWKKYQKNAKCTKQELVYLILLYGELDSFTID